MIFTLNSVHYWIEEYSFGFSWINSNDQEGQICYPTALEAQQDAIEHQKREDASDQDAEEQKADNEAYGTYEKQVRNHHNFIIRH